MVAIVCVATVFTGCSKDEDESSSVTINATVEEGTSYNSSIDEVKAVITDTDTYYTLASGTYSSGSFSLTLPKLVDDSHLTAMDAEYPTEITISDKNAKGCGVEFLAYKSGVAVGSFEQSVTSDDSYSTSVAGYIYVDRNTSFSGTVTETEEVMGIPVSAKTTYDLSLKKGWNVAYIKMNLVVTDTDFSMTLEISDTEISGLKWYYTEGAETSSMIQAKSAAFKTMKAKMFSK